MISFIRGELAEVLEDTVVVENNGIGYNIKVPMSVLADMPEYGSKVKLFTYLHVKEDAMNLYGFLSRDELEMFKMMLGVSGIGPKGALAILSTLTSNELRLAVASDDAKAIAKAPGVGLKTAQKMIIEMKGRISMPEFGGDTTPLLPSGQDIADDARAEAIAALTALGYSNSEAVLAVKKVAFTENMDAEAVLKASLKHLTFL